MKKIFLISFLLASILSFGQHSGYTKQNLKMQWITGAFDSTLHIPAGSGSPSGLRTGAWTGSGAVYVDTTNNVLYFYSGGSWRNSGSATAYVDSLYNSNDSLIYVKNGNAFYIGNLSNTTVVSNQGNHVLSGMVVSYISGLTYHVGPGYYMIEQVVYHFTGGDVTLDAADGSDARLDLIYIDNTMTLGTIDGTPGGTTVTPIEDATTQLGLTTALVAALATTPSNIIDTVIRDEGSAGEWTISKTMTTNDSYSTNPYHGSISQRITGASTGQYIEWIAGSVQSKLRYTNLVFYIRNNSALSSARTFRIGLYNGTTSVGNVLNASLYGYDRAVTGTYMVVAFPMGDFGGADAFDRVRLQNTGIGGPIDVQVDYIRLQANGANNVGSSGVTNITATNNYAQNWTITNPTTTPNLSLVLDTTSLATRGFVNAQGFITRNGISATAPITYNNSTGVIDFDSTHHHTMEYYDGRYLSSTQVYIDSIYNRNDSTFYLKNGIEHFFKGNGIYTSDGTLMEDRTIDINGHDFRIISGNTQFEIDPSSSSSAFGYNDGTDYSQISFNANSGSSTTFFHLTTQHGGDLVELTGDPYSKYLLLHADSIHFNSTLSGSSSGFVWTLKDPATGSGYWAASAGGGGTGSNLSWNTGTHAVDIDGGGTSATIPLADATHTGVLSSSDWNTFNGKLSGNQTITLSGDVTGSGATSISTTVGKINGVALSGLATGILKNTTGTGVPSIAVAGDFPTLNQNTTGSAATLTTTRTIWGQNFNGSANVTGNITLGTSNITMTGSIASTGSRVTKGWFTDLESTNIPTVGGTSLTTLSQTFQNKTLTNSNNVLGGVTMTMGSDANYDIYYRNSSGVLTRLPAGADGNVLTTHSTTSAPTWSAAGGSGVTSIGTINSQTKSANGAVISGSVLYMQDADDTHSGLESSSHHSFVDSLISHTSVIRNSLATGDSLLTKKNDSTLIARKLQLIYEGVNAQTTGSNDSLLKITIPYDTIALATFGAGGGQAGDTAAFSTTSLYGSFFNDGSDTLVITKLIAVMQGTSDTLSVRVQWNDSINVSGTKLVNTPSPINNNYTGNSVTTFDNTKIPPGNWVWCDSPTVIDGRKPKYLSVTLIGYKKRKQ